MATPIGATGSKVRFTRDPPATRKLPAPSRQSMSPIRGDVKKKFSPFPLREETDGGLHPAESQFWRGCGLAAYSGQTGQLAVCTRRFHDAMVVRRLRFWKLRKQTGWL